MWPGLAILENARERDLWEAIRTREEGGGGVHKGGSIYTSNISDSL